MAQRLLIVDADATVREIIKLSAAEENWSFDEAPDGITAIKMLRRGEYSLIILDTDLPDMDGRIVCRYLRKTVKVPVIFTSKNGNEADRLAGFAAGGNDYVIKPFYPRELVARIRNLLRICGTFEPAGHIVSAGNIQIDVHSHVAIIDGRKLQLTPKEYDLLLYFAHNPGQAFSRDALLDMVWGQDFYGSYRTVDTHIKSLRDKLHPYQDVIKTVWGYGYKFEP